MYVDLKSIEKYFRWSLDGLTGRPANSVPWSLSLALSAARMSCCCLLSFKRGIHRVAHVCAEHHATMTDEIKERFNFAEFLKFATELGTVCLILEKIRVRDATVVAYEKVDRPEDQLTLMLRINRVRHGRSRWSLSSINGS